jgi:hypothetical protein
VGRLPCSVFLSGGSGAGGRPRSIADDFDQNALAAKAVELAVKYLLPGAEIQFAAGDRDHRLAAHDGAFEMGIGIVFAPVVRVVRMGLFRGQSLQPLFEIGVKAGFVIVDEDRRGNVHRVDQAEPLADPAFGESGGDLRGEVDEGPPLRDFQPELFAEGFQRVVL